MEEYKDIIDYWVCYYGGDTMTKDDMRSAATEAVLAKLPQHDSQKGSIRTFISVVANNAIRTFLFMNKSVRVPRNTPISFVDINEAQQIDCDYNKDNIGQDFYNYLHYFLNTLQMESYDEWFIFSNTYGLYGEAPMSVEDLEYTTGINFRMQRKIFERIHDRLRQDDKFRDTLL